MASANPLLWGDSTPSASPQVKLPPSGVSPCPGLARRHPGVISGGNWGSQCGPCGLLANDSAPSDYSFRACMALGTGKLGGTRARETPKNEPPQALSPLAPVKGRSYVVTHRCGRPGWLAVDSIGRARATALTIRIWSYCALLTDRKVKRKLPLRTLPGLEAGSARTCWSGAAGLSLSRYQYDRV